ncbi:hypothetical protein A5M85_03850 [Cellulophaga lytica]|nr:hypothetical protein A5M85_03850 [Cellulophaga lytica]
MAGGMPNIYAYVPDANSQFDPFGLAIWDDLGVSFKDWFDQASTQDITNNLKDVTSKKGLRFGGGKHELFPVSQAKLAKELGFTASELEKMSISTNKVEFSGVKHIHTGEVLPNGMHHKSKASSHFHIILMNDLQGAKTKLQAKKIIAKHHKEHMKVKKHH